MTVPGTQVGPQRPGLVRNTLALAGAWMPSVFGSSVLLPQQVEGLVGGPSWTAAYAAISAAGWLTVVVGLTLSGRLQDVGRFGSAGDRRTLPVLALLTAVGGVLVPSADTVLGLGALWVGAMLAPAVAVTLISVRAAGGSSTAGGPGAVASASAIGAAPLLAMLGGSLLIRVPTLTGPGRMMLIALVAAVLLLGAGRPTDPEVALTRDTGPLPPVTDPVVRSAMRRHARLLAGVALVDTGTVTLTFVIVPLVFLLPRAAVGDPGGFAEVLVLAAAVCALVAVWVVPRLPVLRGAPRLLFVASGLAMAVALAVGPFVGTRLLAAVALLAGLAAGSSNAATFGVFLSDPGSRVHRATGLGLLNAMPSMPAVVVPMVAAALLRSTPGAGLTVLMLIAAAAASVGALLVGVADRTR